MDTKDRLGTPWWLGVAIVMFVTIAGAGRRPSCGWCPADAPSAASPAEEILALAARDAGLCVHLGCGRKESAALTADLAAAGRMLGMAWTMQSTG